MRLARLPVVLCCALALASALLSLGSSPAFADSSAPACAAASPAQPATPAAGKPCWVEQTYPFTASGRPILPTDTTCQPAGGSYVPFGCFLQVTSFAFRSWNRGLAATRPIGASASSTPFGVWLFNGDTWFPDPTFPGTKVCPGTQVLWAGKLDFWLVGGGVQSGSSGPPPSNGWGRLCRFDASTYSWEPLNIPQSALNRILLPDGTNRPGGIETGACTAWNDCWFLGDWGTELHWDGTTLNDVSGDFRKTWADAAFSRISMTTNPDGSTSMTAIAEPGEYVGDNQTRPDAPDGSPAPVLYQLSGGQWLPLQQIGATSDPLTTGVTRLTAISLGADGLGWTVGDPPLSGGRFTSPLVSLLAGVGVNSSCTPSGLPTIDPNDPSQPNVRWTGVGALPDGQEGYAVGTEALPGALNGTYTPVIAKISCKTAPALTTFTTTIPDPSFVTPKICRKHPDDPSCTPPRVPAPAGACITQQNYATPQCGVAQAVAANADNDAWVATSYGQPFQSDVGRQLPLRLYRLTDGQTPDAPAGDDVESRPIQLNQDIVTYLFTPPAAAPPTVVAATTKTLKASVFDIKVTAHGLRIFVAFQLRRPTTIGVVATKTATKIVKKKRTTVKTTVATTGYHKLASGKHTLVLKLNRKKWPNGLHFITKAS